MPVYKKEQAGTWFCKFCYTDWNGVRKQKKKEGFKTKKEALDYERDFLSRAATDCEISFSRLVELYLEDCRPRLKPTTLETKENMIRRRILPYFEKLPVEKITASTIRRWQNDLMAQGFSPTYLKSIHYYFATYEDANEDDTLWVVIVKNMVDNATEDAE